MQVKSEIKDSFSVAMVSYATYLVYKSEKIKKMLEVGADTLKYKSWNVTLYRDDVYCCRTLSQLDLKAGSSSLVALGSSVRRKTMERLAASSSQAQAGHQDEERLVNGDTADIFQPC